ncbi:DUF6428 family protein [Chitinophaga cymbidii]|uniref:Uncharacterized protein n=1 Tax=Chitinophaga cymbidii TaxID=1096750 RepID=A0A512RRW2_9BACT|nr:DUF6428 family protein [Chitinophaga cymbidii]GEP98440.1 hypothetical protein CCY01nite_47000 [Chitinophaga cymbidii]
MENKKMNWDTFKTSLRANPGQILQFQYAAGKWVAASYHITEIKHAPVTSVDCGGVMNAWTEVIVQLWEPSEKQSDRAMEASKALKIIDLVESKIDLHPKAVVKIEFGNHSFDTRQMYPDNIVVDGENLIVHLQPDATQCKANDRGQTCGTPKPDSLKILATADACTPGGGCC